MEPRDMLRKFSDCHYELEKVEPGEISDCNKCPLAEDIEVELVEEGTPISRVTLTIMPCTILAEMANKIKG